MAAITTPSPLAQAIDEFLDDMKARQRKTPFYKEILTSRSVLAPNENPREVHIRTKELEGFVKELEERRAKSKTLRTLRTLAPFVNGIVTLMDACFALIQASPFAFIVALSVARFVLKLATNTNSAFDLVTETMGKIGTYLQYYGKFAVAYKTSDEVRECLVASYKNIVNFCATASNLLYEHVVRWKIPNENGWRVWDPERDGKSTDLKLGFDYIRMLRSGFGDGERKFDVPIRSGLDWTRKVFLSCA
ncbi:uncharacterized protein N7479_004807 [Penicillium vulpinum]|uniref:uncharacterized protein n=1 Tax=Penicillium vulpinum TaxID=29845 RepID=UPI002547AB5B|nr:uncharacterized protein N7479_004807 [Penicillium vulpinum]KAJ5964931.1 hypothetical protein N7479_004807 [Penicillium vulpinum]